MHNELTEYDTHEINHHCRGLRVGEGYNRETLREVSTQLGHGRGNAVIRILIMWVSFLFF
ncbi:hypothetical protein [Clostridium pasteurianum]|uniref:hypothetical protein n=1 Tax=Clostridium pasteurianum TaxID=1501 RepID=UPI0003A844FE|nr:hypothetical protein [Clostridium pasteurianum]